MTRLRRDHQAKAATVAGPPAPSFDARKAGYLTIVPIDSQRSSSAQATVDWSADIRRVAQSQDRAAFARLFAHFAPRIKSYLIRTGSVEEQAEEVAQEALAAVWRKAALFDSAQAAASTWVFWIARNLRVDAARRHRLDHAGDACFDFDSLAAEQDGIADQLDASQMAQRVRAALEQLPPEQAQVLKLSFYDDEPHARIATELGIPLGTVKSRMRTGVARLRRLLER